VVCDKFQGNAKKTLLWGVVYRGYDADPKRIRGSSSKSRGSKVGVTRAEVEEGKSYSADSSVRRAVENNRRVEKNDQGGRNRRPVTWAAQDKGW